MNHPWLRFLPRFIQTKLEGRDSLKKIISNTGWLFADRILRIIGELVVGIWLARYLGPDKFGLFSYAIALVTVFSAIARLGLDQIVVRELVQNPSCQYKTLGTTFFLKLVGGIATLLLAMLALYSLQPNDRETIVLVSIIGSGIIFQSFDAIDIWFRAQLRSKYTVIARDTAFLTVLAFKIILIQLQASLIMFAWASLAEMVFYAMTLVIVYQVGGQNLLKWSFSKKQAKALLNDSWPLILSSITIMIYMRLDQIMIGQMIGKESLGIYSAAVRISEGWYFIPQAISTSFMPSLVAAKEQSEGNYYQRLQFLFDLVVIIGYLVAGLVTISSGYIINLLYGEAYREASLILSVHVWAGLFVSLGVARSLWTTTENLTKYALATTLTGAVFNVMANYILIPKYGIVGAAVATLISQILVSWLLNVIRKQTRVIFTMQLKSLLLHRVTP